jgi:hypothetical protein
MEPSWISHIESGRRTRHGQPFSESPLLSEYRCPRSRCERNSSNALTNPPSSRGLLHKIPECLGRIVRLPAGHSALRGVAHALDTGAAGQRVSRRGRMLSSAPIPNASNI